MASIFSSETSTLTITSQTSTLTITSQTSTLTIPTQTSTVTIPSETSTVTTPRKTSTVTIPRKTSTAPVFPLGPQPRRFHLDLNRTGCTRNAKPNEDRKGRTRVARVARARPQQGTQEVVRSVCGKRFGRYDPRKS